MMLTTPEMAPEPYAAEAPPVTTSMRWMRFDGMKFRSTLSPCVVGMKRRESTSVSVRVPKNGFRPRKLASVDPMKNALPPVFAGVNCETFCGICVIASATFTMPRFCRSSEPIVVIGFGDA